MSFPGSNQQKSELSVQPISAREIEQVLDNLFFAYFLIKAIKD